MIFLLSGSIISLHASQGSFMDKIRERFEQVKKQWEELQRRPEYQTQQTEAGKRMPTAEETKALQDAERIRAELERIRSGLSRQPQPTPAEKPATWSLTDIANRIKEALGTAQQEAQQVTKSA
jgi:hypothetical protein